MKYYKMIIVSIVMSSIYTVTYSKISGALKVDILSKRAAIEYFDVEAQILLFGQEYPTEKDRQIAQCARFRHVISLAEEAQQSAKRIIGNEKSAKSNVDSARRSFDRAEQVIFAVNSKWCFNHTCDGINP